jgi:hypothetical protein
MVLEIVTYAYIILSLFQRCTPQIAHINKTKITAFQIVEAKPSYSFNACKILQDTILVYATWAHLNDGLHNAVP